MKYRSIATVRARQKTRINTSKMTVTDFKAALHKKNLSTKGNKAELKARLEAAINPNSEYIV